MASAQGRTTGHVQAQDARLRTLWITVAGLRCHARLAPAPLTNAPTIVLVHGYAVSGRYLEPTAERLAATNGVIVPDLPGFGRSERPGHVPDVPALAAYLAETLKALGVERAILAGNSFGAQIAAELALRAPERALALVLIGPTVDARARSIPTLVWRLARDLHHEPLRLWFIQARDYLRFGPRRQFWTARHMLSHHIETVLTAIDAPILLARGEHDTIAPALWLRDLARAAPDATIVTVPNAAHAVTYSDPAALADVIRSFVAERLVTG